VITEDQARELLRNQASEYDVLPVAGDALAAHARSASRRRRIVSVAAAGVAAAAVVVAAMTLAPNSPTAPDRGDPPIANPVPVAPDGYRLVGMNGIVVAVPEGWGTNEVMCGVATSDTVYFPGNSTATRACGYRGPAADQVSLVSTSSEWAQGYTGWRDGGEVGEHHLRVVPIDDKSVGPWSAAVMVEDLDVIVSIKSNVRSEVEAILESLDVLPEGYATVPPPRVWGPIGNVTTAISLAGLNPVVVEEYRPGWSAGSLIRTEPALGSVVAAGAEVTVVMTGPNPEADGWPGVFVRDDPHSAISCVSQYPDKLVTHTNAFDATVTNVRVGVHGRGGSGTPVDVTLQVNETFAGDAAASVVMHTWDFMLPRDPQTILGTRILAAAGPTLDIKSCGYTRPYDEKTASEWRDVF
jgi:hypothetical protein